MTPTAPSHAEHGDAPACHGFLTDLVLRCGEGDEAALADLFDLTFFLVSRTITRGAGRSAAIDEEVVRAFARIWTRSPGFEPRAQGVLAWVLDQVVDS